MKVYRARGRQAGRQAGSQSDSQTDGRVRSVSASLAWAGPFGRNPTVGLTLVGGDGGDNNGEMAMVMSVDSNKSLLSDTPYTPNTLCAHVSQSARQPSERQEVRDSEERQHLWPKDKPGQPG